MSRFTDLLRAANGDRVRKELAFRYGWTPAQQNLVGKIFRGERLPPKLPLPPRPPIGAFGRPPRRGSFF